MKSATMRDKKRALLISSVVLLPFTFLLFQFTTQLLGAKWGYITGFLGYWSYCLLTVWYLSGPDLEYFKCMWYPRRSGKYVKWIALAAFLPALGTFFVSFLPNAPLLTFSTAILLVLTAVINGSIEELYWRGLYLVEYPNDTRIGFIFSWLLFGAWHISLWFARGITYEDGFLALVGGAFGLGLLWTWSARTSGNLRTVIPAHILTNLFAFTALFVDNGF
jgi:membrane protease YdiL (CAAX protease family)